MENKTKTKKLTDYLSVSFVPGKHFLVIEYVQYGESFMISPPEIEILYKFIKSKEFLNLKEE